MDQLLGNEQNLARLKTLAQGSLSHAYIISGPAGSGKKTLAAYFARAILCLDEQKPCGRCASCMMLESGNHPDIVTICPGGASHTIKVDDVRDMRSGCYIKPLVGAHRVIIIEEAHTMNVNAQNALLKIMEEPPQGTVFLLLTDAFVRLLPTIRSRATLITMSLPDKQELADYLCRFENACTTVKAQAAADLSDGVVGEARELMNADANSPCFIAVDFMNALCGHYLYDFIKMRDRLCKSREHCAKTLEMLIKLCCDICAFMAQDKDNLHFEYITVATISKKLTKAKALNIISLLRSLSDSVAFSAADIRVTVTDMLLSCWDAAH